MPSTKLKHGYFKKSKTMEAEILDCEWLCLGISLIEQHNNLLDSQLNFRKNRSCETPLINTIETMILLYGTKHQIDLEVLDFSKAFDTVAHKLRLCLKLEPVDIRNIIHHDSTCQMHNRHGECEQQLLMWFHNWLCGKTQQVNFEGESSAMCHLTSGVPQGTVLRPLCFLICMNDIAENL